MFNILQRGTWTSILPSSIAVPEEASTLAKELEATRSALPTKK